MSDSDFPADFPFPKPPPPLDWEAGQRLPANEWAKQFFDYHHRLLWYGEQLILCAIGEPGEDFNYPLLRLVRAKAEEIQQSIVQDLAVMVELLPLAPFAQQQIDRVRELLDEEGKLL